MDKISVRRRRSKKVGRAAKRQTATDVTYRGTAQPELHWLERPTTSPSKIEQFRDYFSCRREGNQRILTFVVLPIVVIVTCAVLILILLSTTA